MDRENISLVADTVRKVFEFKGPPYEPMEVITGLNGGIVYDLEDPASDAYINKKGDDSFEIHLNGNKPNTRERFTLAHELGHLFLHMGFIIDKEKWDSFGGDREYKDSVFYRKDNNYSIEEYEANEFAASFLMPKEEFILKAEEHLYDNKYELDPIANHFGVSLEAVSFRGKWLGIFSW